MTLTALPDPLRRIVEARVAELWKRRQFYRKRLWPDWSDEASAELRALIRLLRAARLQEKADTVWHAPTANGTPPTDWYGHLKGGHYVTATPESADPVTAAKGYHDLQAGL